MNSRNEYLFHWIKILILKKYVFLMKSLFFQKCIPVSWDKNINFEEVRWKQKYIPVSLYENINFDEVVVFPEMYTWFELYKYLFSSSTLISRIVYTFQVMKISILIKYVEFQKWIPVPGDQNINFQEVRWFPEMYTCFRL